MAFFSRYPYYLLGPIVHAAVVIRTFSYYRPDCVAGLFESSFRPMNNNIRNPFAAQNLLVIGTRYKSNLMKNIIT